MERIIAGRFQTIDAADAAAALIARYVDTSDISVFYNNPPGQHDAYYLGGDEDEDPGTHGAGKSAAGMAVVGGLAGGAIGALGGPVVAIAAAGAGALTGSLVGAMAGLGREEVKPTVLERRPSGVMLSVRIAKPMNERRVIASLRDVGAECIEQAMGAWRDGRWTDFDPVTVPHLVAVN